MAREEEIRPHQVSAGSVKFSFTVSEPTVSLVKAKVDPKPPRPPFIDRNLKAGKFVLKEGAREAVVGLIKWLLLGRKRQPAEAEQV